MTRIDFYILPVAEPHGALSFACRLTEKAFLGGHRVYLHSASEAQARMLDELLWTFRDGSFVPHELLPGDSPTPDCPVAVGVGGDPGEHHDVLVNLGEDIPSFFARFERVAEIVLNDPAALAESRRRWAFYKDRGYALQHHDMQSLRGNREQ
jgi:DNA polymerase-3 subunit chi